MNSDLWAINANVQILTALVLILLLLLYIAYKLSQKSVPRLSKKYS